MFTIATTGGARSAWSRPRQHDLDLARYRPLISASPTDGTKAPTTAPAAPCQRLPLPVQPAASTAGAAAIVAGWAGAGADVTTTWPQNSLVALDCEARIVRARSGFQRIRIAIRLIPATHCHALPVGGR
jgi:hypothetical protein